MATFWRFFPILHFQRAQPRAAHSRPAFFYVGGRTLPRPRLQLNLEPTAHSAHNDLLHMASKWSSHRTTRAGLSIILGTLQKLKAGNHKAEYTHQTTGDLMYISH